MSDYDPQDFGANNRDVISSWLVPAILLVALIVGPVVLRMI